MVRIDPGKFNVFFTLQTLSVDDDGAGGTNEPVWSDVAHFWGELSQSGSGRGIRDTQFVFDYSYQVKTHYMSELEQLTERARLVTNHGWVLYIDNIENIDTKNFFAVIKCSKEK
ncbi:MAG: hypothetical protein EA392_01510 [Cryomorphaceae bacterium]|nr:MAG: hypothetical protein EA392_01510 [Cryomorphaceae bacterium]